MPSCDFTSEDFFSSPTMSMQSSTHSSQMNTVGPAMSLRTSCWLLPQNVQWSLFLVSPPLTLLISKARLDARRQSLPLLGQTTDMLLLRVRRPDCSTASAVSSPRHIERPALLGRL